MFITSDQLAAASRNRIERERREAIAAERAATLAPDDYFAYDNDVCTFVDGKIEPVMTCESHWGACLVMLAKGKEPTK